MVSMVASVLESFWLQDTIGAGDSTVYGPDCEPKESVDQHSPDTSPMAGETRVVRSLFCVGRERYPSVLTGNLGTGNQDGRQSGFNDESQLVFGARFDASPEGGSPGSGAEANLLATARFDSPRPNSCQ
jgi:hypothetical protein